MTDKNTSSTIPIGGLEDHFYIKAHYTDGDGNRIPVYLAGYSIAKGWVDWTPYRVIAKPLRDVTVDQFKALPNQLLAGGARLDLSDFETERMYDQTESVTPQGEKTT